MVDAGDCVPLIANFKVRGRSILYSVWENKVHEILAPSSRSQEDRRGKLGNSSDLHAAFPNRNGSLCLSSKVIWSDNMMARIEHNS